MELLSASWCEELAKGDAAPGMLEASHGSRATSTGSS